LQAVTNIIKNATEAISRGAARRTRQRQDQVFAGRDGDNIVIDVIDNGIGLPKENRSRLLEPYVTTREKGTGLGLAIVGRIVETTAAASSCVTPPIKFRASGRVVRVAFAAPENRKPRSPIN